MLPMEFVESYFDAWNHGDPKGVADHLASNGIYCDIPENSRQNRDELIADLTESFAQQRNRYELIGDILLRNDTIAFQYQILPLHGSHGHDENEAQRGAEFITLNGDAALTITDYYDLPGESRPTVVSCLVDETGNRGSRKYAKSGLSDKLLAQYQRRLEIIMLEKKAYLRPDLTLPKLAAAVGCSVNHLSQVINSGLGMSFFDYLNSCRVDHARELLSRVDDHKEPILNIAFSVGFNSNSAFYSAFKKCVGKTPAQYRRACEHAIR